MTSKVSNTEKAKTNKGEKSEPKQSVSPLPVAVVITGRDLRLMRLRAEMTTSDMAEKLQIKSRKTIENWEQQNSEPQMNVFIRYCAHTGFNPCRVIQEIIKRNEADPSQKNFFNMDACADHDGGFRYKLKKLKILITQHKAKSTKP